MKLTMVVNFSSSLSEQIVLLFGVLETHKDGY